MDPIVSQNIQTLICEELDCSICKFHLEDPVVTECDHLFCRKCIYDWLKYSQSCPVDRQALTERDLYSPHRIVRNLLDKLKVKCEFADEGCPLLIKLESHKKHVNECKFNPKMKLRCDMCDNLFLREEMKGHKCWIDIMTNCSEQKESIDFWKRLANILFMVILLWIMYIRSPLVLIIFILITAYIEYNYSSQEF